MSEFFSTIVNMSISASWIVLAVFLLRLLLKKAPKWITVLLWGIVAIRLICPFTIESVMSLIFFIKLPHLFHIECQPLGAVAVKRELGAILILDKAVLDLIPAAQVLAHLWVWGNRFHPHLSLGAHLRLS